MKSEKLILSGPNYKSKDFLRKLNGTSYDQYLLNAVRRRTNEVYMIEAVTNVELLISEFVEKSFNLAAHLQGIGCSKRTIVGIVSENCSKFPIAVLGSLLTGATVTCFNPAYTIRELEHVIDISQPFIIFSSPRNYNKVIQLKQSASYIKHVIVFDNTKTVTSTKEYFPFSSLVRTTLSYSYQKVVNRAHDLAVILYSSGTTGLPKGVMLTHRNLVYMAKVNGEEGIFHLPGKIGLNILPMFHTFSFNIMFMTLVMDQTVIVMRKFEEEPFLALIEKHKIRYLFLVPTTVVFLLKNPLVNKYDISSVEHVICGAAAMKNETEEAFTKKMKLKCLQQGYGMTELTLATTVKSATSSKLGTCGSAIPGSQIKVIDLETGESLGVGKSGEICVKGPHVMKGYYKNEKATSETIDDYGWLHTGDIGYYDEDGDFFIVDRVKDLIKYKGFQVPPAELEALLLTHPDVYDVAVIGLPDEMAGEIPRAFVVRQCGSFVTEEELIHYISENVSPQKRLRGGVTFVSEIPKNPSGKILRRKLRDLDMKIKSKY